METLFPIEPRLPEGFQRFPDFLSEEELLTEVSKIDLHNLIFQEHEAKRKVANFGYEWVIRQLIRVC